MKKGPNKTKLNEIKLNKTKLKDIYSRDRNLDPTQTDSLNQLKAEKEITAVHRDETNVSAMTNPIDHNDIPKESHNLKAKEKTIETIQEILSYLNQQLQSRCGRGRYTIRSKKTVKLINDRFVEGYTIDDFKYVIFSVFKGKRSVLGEIFSQEQYYGKTTRVYYSNKKISAVDKEALCFV